MPLKRPPSTGITQVTPVFTSDPYASAWDGVGPSLIDPAGKRGSGAWRSGWPTGVHDVHVYQTTKSASPPPITAYQSQKYPQGCTALVEYTNTDAQGNIESGNTIVRAALIPVDPNNTWRIARPSQARWEPGGSAAKDPGTWFGGASLWAGRWTLPARCGQWNDPQAPFQKAFQQLNDISTAKLAGKMDIPSSPIGMASTDWVPCPDYTLASAEAGQAYMSAGAGPDGKQCRGLWWQSPQAAEIVFLQMTPSASPPPPPCPGKQCEYHVYDLAGTGYAAFSFQPDGTILQRFQRVRSNTLGLLRDYSYLEGIAPKGVDLTAQQFSRPGYWQSDPSDPSKKVWIEGNRPTLAQGGTTAGVAADPSAPLPGQSGVAFGYEANPCGAFRKTNPDGSCSIRWGLVAAAAASIFFLT